MKKWNGIVAIVGIVVLEAINMLALRHNGTMLLLCVATIAGIAGFKLGQTEKPEQSKIV